MSRRTVAVRSFLGLLAALAAWPALAAAPDCSRKDAQKQELMVALRDCVFGVVEPMGFNGEASPGAVADAGLAACAAQRQAQASYLKACDPGRAAQAEADMRAAVIDFVGEARLPRADRVWLHGGWQKGACALDNPTFKAAVHTHMGCIRSGVRDRLTAADKGEDIDFARVVDDSFAACAVSQIPVKAVFAQCVAKPDALNASYRAGAIESVLADLVDANVTGHVINPEQAKNEDLRQRIDDYGACVAFEAHSRKGRKPIEGAREEAIRVCGLDRSTLTDAVNMSLPEAERAEALLNIDTLAKVEASLELPEPGDAAKVRSAGLAVKPGADPKCADAAALGEQVMKVRDCVMAKAAGLAGADTPAKEIADQAMASCTSERAQLAAYEKSCRFDPAFADDTARKAIEREVAERRLPRADRLWTYANDWMKGSCSLEDKVFEARTNGVLGCMASAAAHDLDPNVSTVGASVRALGKCQAEQAKVAEAVKGCVGPRADAVMQDFRAWAAEAVTVIQLDASVDDKLRATAPEMKETDYFSMLEIYVACVALEAYQHHGKGARDAILDEAARVCEASRKDVAYLVAQRTPEAQQADRLDYVDRAARGIASSALDELDGKPAAAAKGG